MNDRVWAITCGLVMGSWAMAASTNAVSVTFHTPSVIADASGADTAVCDVRYIGTAALVPAGFINASIYGGPGVAALLAGPVGCVGGACVPNLDVTDPPGLVTPPLPPGWPVYCEVTYHRTAETRMCVTLTMLDATGTPLVSTTPGGAPTCR